MIENHIRTAHKFGGADMDDLTHVCEIIERIHRSGDRPLVVVSAFKNITDMLLAALDTLDGTLHTDEDAIRAFTPTAETIAAVIENHFSRDPALKERAQRATAEHMMQAVRLIREYKAVQVKENKTTKLSASPEAFTVRDKVIALGEKNAAELLHILLEHRGIKNIALLDIQQVPQEEDKEPNSKRAIHRAIQDGIRKRLNEVMERAEDHVLVMGGHIGDIDISRRVGRNYSDGTLLDAGVALRRCGYDGDNPVTIWKKVSGLLPADPDQFDPDMKKSIHEKVIHHVSLDEGLKIAIGGAQLLNADTIQTAIRERVGIVVKDISNPDALGTKYDAVDITTKQPFKAICTRTCDLLSFSCAEMAGDNVAFQSALIKMLEERGIPNADILSQDSCIEIVVRVPDDKNKSERDYLRAQLADICRTGRTLTVHGEKYEMNIGWKQGSLTNISIVGNELANRPGILGEMATVLAADNINISKVGHTVEQNRVAFYVESIYERRAVQILYRYFIERAPSVQEYVRKKRDENSRQFAGNPKTP